MKLLLTADLHFRIDWFRWLIGQAPNYDLVCIVGDLLDMFEVKSTREQAREVSSLIRGLADIVSVAVCSGTTIMPVDSSRMIDRHCMSGSLIWARIQTSVTDGATRKLEDSILTTIPYHCSKEEKAIWLDRGLTIRRQTGKPWMVLHHVPSKTGPGVSGEESEAAELLLAYRPDFFASGHDHAFPYKSGQSWNQRMGEVCVLGVSQTGTIQVLLRWDVSCFKR